MNAFGNKGASAAPCLHLHHQDESDSKGKPSAMRNLDDVCAQETKLENKEWTADQHGTEFAPVPSVGENTEENQRGNCHCHGDGNAVCGRQVGGRAKPDHQADACNHEYPVHERYVDLSGMALRSVTNLDTRQIVHLDCLCCERKNSGYQGLRRNDGGTCCE